MTKSFLWLLILIADIWAIVKVFQSNATSGAKILWTLLILIFPIVGLIVWFFAGPGTKKI